MPGSRKICFIVNDYQFMFRHFEPAISAARSQGLQVIAYLPEPEAAARKSPGDVAVVPSPIDRTTSILSLLRQSLWLARRLRRDSPHIVTVFSVRVAVALLLVLPFVPVKKTVIYITGLGLLELLHDRKSRMLRRMAYFALRLAGRSPSCTFIFENSSDPVSMGFKSGYPKRQVMLMGAGVDPNEFLPQAFPPDIPFRLATVSRLVWSKGIDLAIDAVSGLVKEGYPVELDVYGSPDRLNPLSFDPSRWADIPGISFKGHVADVPKVWAQHHAAIFASRGGEGTPRALLEAAACGRPCIVTDVPGCRDFVRDGVEGYIAKPNSAADLKDAILKLLRNQAALPAFGKAARDRVLQTSTRDTVIEQYKNLFEA